MNQRDIGVKGSLTQYGYGDSMMLSYGVSAPAMGWLEQMGMNRMWRINNNGVSGQPVTTGLAGSFDPTTIVTKTASSTKLFLSWGVNDCWKAPNLAAFQTSLTACFNTANSSKSWPYANIVHVTDWFCVDNVNFTVAQYRSYVDAAETICNSLGVQCIRLFNYMQANGGTNLLSDGIIHLNDLGGTVAKNYISANVSS